MTSDTARKIGEVIARITLTVGIAVAAGFAFDLTVWQVVVVALAINYEPGATTRPRP